MFKRKFWEELIWGSLTDLVFSPDSGSKGLTAVFWVAPYERHRRHQISCASRDFGKTIPFNYQTSLLESSRILRRVLSRIRLVQTNVSHVSKKSFLSEKFSLEKRDALQYSESRCHVLSQLYKSFQHFRTKFHILKASFAEISFRKFSQLIWLSTN